MGPPVTRVNRRKQKWTIEAKMKRPFPWMVWIMFFAFMSLGGYTFVLKNQHDKLEKDVLKLGQLFVEENESTIKTQRLILERLESIENRPSNTKIIRIEPKKSHKRSSLDSGVPPVVVTYPKPRI